MPNSIWPSNNKQNERKLDLEYEERQTPGCAIIAVLAIGGIVVFALAIFLLLIFMVWLLSL